MIALMRRKKPYIRHQKIFFRLTLNIKHFPYSNLVKHSAVVTKSGINLQ